MGPIFCGEIRLIAEIYSTGDFPQKVVHCSGLVSQSDPCSKTRWLVWLF